VAFMVDAPPCEPATSLLTNDGQSSEAVIARTVINGPTPRGAPRLPDRPWRWGSPLPKLVINLA
jgi:hypothetical protein